eukprot:Skav205383  [mRNA]  locus=scaffold277:160950:165688:+ [translate_table: standard]
MQRACARLAAGTTGPLLCRLLAHPTLGATGRCGRVCRHERFPAPVAALLRSGMCVYGHSGMTLMSQLKQRQVQTDVFATNALLSAAEKASAWKEALVLAPDDEAPGRGKHNCCKCRGCEHGLLGDGAGRRRLLGSRAAALRRATTQAPLRQSMADGLADSSGRSRRRERGSILHHVHSTVMGLPTHEAEQFAPKPSKLWNFTAELSLGILDEND